MSNSDVIFILLQTCRDNVEESASGRKNKIINILLVLRPAFNFNREA
jgi:hypothetical protein